MSAVSLCCYATRKNHGIVPSTTELIKRHAKKRKLIYGEPVCVLTLFFLLYKDGKKMKELEKLVQKIGKINGIHIHEARYRNHPQGKGCNQKGQCDAKITQTSHRNPTLISLNPEAACGYESCIAAVCGGKRINYRGTNQSEFC